MGFQFTAYNAPVFLVLLVLVPLQHSVSGNVGHACESLYFPFCDTTKRVADRVEDLISRLTLQEKVQQLGNSAPGIPRLGIPSYQWWQEALHGVAESIGVNFSGPIKAATSFPQPILTASSFNDTIFMEIGKVVSTEARAMYNTNQSGLTFWSPNINIFRDPRWGRGQETAGEDPRLSGNYAVAFVRGMQEREDAENITTDVRLKTSACCKHFSAYDLEKWGEADRDHFDAVVTKQDMEDTFNPPFRACIQEGRASGLMCAYNRVNGVPMCGSHSFLTEIARDTWGFDGYIVSDCDAVYDMTNEPAYSMTLEDAVADALQSGVDLNCGITFRDHSELALSQGKLQESHFDAGLRHTLSVRMRLGLFDGDPQRQTYGHLGVPDVCTTENQALALEAALQGIVLLKNDQNVLPLSAKQIRSLAVLGPNAADDDYRMLGDYAGIPCKYVTPAQGLGQYVDNILYHPGCVDSSCVEKNFSGAASAAAEADAVVIVVGLSLSQENEGVDRTSLLLPGHQEELVSLVAQVAKGPVVLLILSGGPVDISFAKDDPLVSCIMWAGYPGQSGGHAIAEIIFGSRNPGGKLPMTWYPESFTRVPMTNMNMRPDRSLDYPGRSYRFYEEEPVFKFGYGLSYTRFTVTFTSAPLVISVPSMRKRTCLQLNSQQNDGISHCSALDMHVCNTANFQVSVTVRNEGARSGSNVVILYTVPPWSGKEGVVLKTLVSYKRVSLDAGAECELVFYIEPCKDMSTVNQSGERFLDYGEHTLLVGDNVKLRVLFVEMGSESSEIESGHHVSSLGRL